MPEGRPGAGSRSPHHAAPRLMVPASLPGPRCRYVGGQMRASKTRARGGADHRPERAVDPVRRSFRRRPGIASGRWGGGRARSVLATPEFTCGDGWEAGRRGSATCRRSRSSTTSTSSPAPRVRRRRRRRRGSSARWPPRAGPSTCWCTRCRPTPGSRSRSSTARTARTGPGSSDLFDSGGSTGIKIGLSATGTPVDLTGVDQVNIIPKIQEISATNVVTARISVWVILTPF